MSVVVSAPQYEEHAYLVTLEDLLAGLGIDAPDEASIKVDNYDRPMWHKRDVNFGDGQIKCRAIITVRTYKR
jgi:hypothetical protein